MLCIWFVFNIRSNQLINITHTFRAQFQSFCIKFFLLHTTQQRIHLNSSVFFVCSFSYCCIVTTSTIPFRYYSVCDCVCAALIIPFWFYGNCEKKQKNKRHTVTFRYDQITVSEKRYHNNGMTKTKANKLICVYQSKWSMFEYRVLFTYRCA